MKRALTDIKAVST